VSLTTIQVRTGNSLCKGNLYIFWLSHALPHARARTHTLSYAHTHTHTHTHRRNASSFNSKLNSMMSYHAHTHTHTHTHIHTYAYVGASYKKVKSEWRGRFFGQGNIIAASHLTCYKALGDATVMVDVLRNATGEAIMIARFETLLHKGFGNDNFWRIRRRCVCVCVCFCCVYVCMCVEAAAILQLNVPAFLVSDLFSTLHRSCMHI